MERKNNYLIQAEQAKKRFLTYDQDKLIGKFALDSDRQYLYATMLTRKYRIHRQSGDMEYAHPSRQWDAVSFEEVMTLLDLLCDSREDRRPAHSWKDMESFGLHFHQKLLERKREPMAELATSRPEDFRRACETLGGTPQTPGDICYAFDFFDGLPLLVQFWDGDEEFDPWLRYLWDENATMYLRYETMYFAVDLFKRRIRELMCP